MLPRRDVIGKAPVLLVSEFQRILVPLACPPLALVEAGALDVLGFSYNAVVAGGIVKPRR
jgi:hypothetical protein